MQLGGELLSVFLEQRFYRPVLDRLERANLALTLYQEAKRDGLNASRRDSFLDGLPEHRARLVADQSIEHATRLLRIDFALIDVARVLNRALHRITRDLVEQHATHRCAVTRLDLLRDVPGDGF